MSPATARFSTSPAVASNRQIWRQPLLLWALVMAVALLSFYVHVLNEHVARKDAQRALQRSAQAPSGPAYAADAQRAAPVAVRIAQTTPR